MGRAGTHRPLVPGKRSGHRGDAASGKTAKTWKTWGLRLLTLAFFALAAIAMARLADTLDVETLLATLGDYRASTLALAAALAACSFCLYACYELVARRYSGHRLPPALTGLVGAIAYAFNLNLGAWIGGIGFRYRLYSELGIDTPVTARVYLSALTTNWSGYIAVAGVAFSFYGLVLPPQWELSDGGLRGLGVLLLVLAAAYLVLCARHPEGHVTIRGHEFDLPGARMAAMQMALGACNWMLMAGVVYTLMPHGAGGLGYGSVLAMLLVASIAGVISHIPAGLGVLEAVFLSLAGHLVPESRLLAVLLAYRAVYFIGPLLLAGVAYALLEAGIKRRK